jgi:hypothetical protein
MATATPIRRDWIATEFSKGIQAEQDFVETARERGESPPAASLQVLYHELAVADERHRTIVETIAARYGHTPSKGMGAGIGQTLGRLKMKVGDIGASPLRIVGEDLKAKANAIHWYVAWIKTFESIGDPDSARELAAVLTEEKAHRDALQEGLNRLVRQEATGMEPALAS